MKKIHILISAVITILLVWFLLKELKAAGLKQEDLFDIVLNTDKPLFFTYLTMSLTALVVRSWRYLVLLHRVDETSGHIGFSKMTVVTAIRNALVDMFPARLGEASFFYVLKRFGINLISATSVFSLCLALDLAVLAIVFSVVLLALLIGGGAGSGLELNWAVILGAGLFSSFLLTALYYSDKVVAKVLEYTGKIPTKGGIDRLKVKLTDFASRIGEDLEKTRETGSYPLLIFQTLILRVAKYGSLYVLVLAVVKQWGLGASDIDPLITSVSFILAEATASLPISGLMGFGAYEGAWSIIMKMSESRIPATLSLALIVHVLTQLVGYTVGLVGAIALVAMGFSRMGPQTDEPDNERAKTTKYERGTQ